MTDQFIPIERKRKSSNQSTSNQTNQLPPTTNETSPSISTATELMHPTSVLTKAYSVFQAIHDLFQLTFHPSIQTSPEHLKYERIIQLRHHILLNQLSYLLHSNTFNDYIITLPIDPTKTLYNLIPSGPIALLGAAYLGVILQSTDSPTLPSYFTIIQFFNDRLNQTKLTHNHFH
jgi:hypothetical protein